MNNSFEINIDFVNDLRLYYSIMILNFDEDIKEIVPQNLTHNSLLSNNKIDEYIVKFYYLPTVRFITDEEFQEIVSTGYVGKKETTFTPYSFVIYGAYHTRIGLFYKLKHIKELGITINKKPIKSLNDLIPYFKEYRNGFEFGFNEFEKECINPFLPMFADKNDFTNKVFEYVTKDIIFSHSWFNNHSGFTTQDKEILIDTASKDGQKQGYFYKAWTLILSNSNLFAPLFKERFEEKNNNENDLKQNTELTQLLERKKEFKNGIKRAEEKIIAQNNVILKQKQRAEDGLENTLAFEQSELPKYISEKINLEEELSKLKNRIKAFGISENKMQTQKSQQLNETKIIKPDEIKLEFHTHIFKSNAFEVWQSMFDEFEVNESSRTDVKFMYEEMKKEGLIYNTVNQKTFLEWITSTYDGLIIQKTSNHNRTRDRLRAYLRAKNLLKK